MRVVTDPQGGRGSGGDPPACDALVTTTPHVALFTLVADCTPVLLLDPDAGVAAVDVAGAGYVFEMREATRCVQQGLLESPVMPWADSLELVELFDRVRAQIGVQYPHDAR